MSLLKEDFAHQRLKLQATVDEREGQMEELKQKVRCT
jgi:hypothetical protein